MVDGWLLVVACCLLMFVCCSATINHQQLTIKESLPNQQPSKLII